MPQKLNQFSKAGFIEFDSGCFDGWCVFAIGKEGEEGRVIIEK